MIQKTNIEAYKIDSTTLKIYGMIVFTFFILYKDGKEKFFEKNFLLADINLHIVLGLPFLIMSNNDIDFQAWNL